MVSPGSRLFFALSAFGLIGAIAYGIGSGGDFLGTICLGWKGGVGEHLGYSIFVTLFAGSLATAVFLAVVRDADPVLVGATDAVPEAPLPAGFSPWPLVGALGALLALLGLVVDELLFVVGIILVVMTIVEWAVTDWSERATGDPEVNRAIRNRLMLPVEIPVAAVLIIGFVVVGLSRVLLAVSPHWAVGIGVMVLFIIVLSAVLVLRSPGRAPTIITALLLLGALAVVAVGIVGIVAGPRDFHEESPASESGE